MNNVRNLCSILCILAVTFVFTNCQQDTNAEIQESITLQKEFPYQTSLLSKHDIENNVKLSNQMNSITNIQSNDVSKSIYNSVYDFTIHTDAINFVESTEDNSHSYTFPIERTNNVGSHLENLVFTYNESSDDYTASIVTYHFTASQKQEFLQNQHVSTVYDISFEAITLDANEVLGKNATPCTTTYTVYHITPDTGETFVHTGNGQHNACQHEDADGNTQCETYTVIEINCPDGGNSTGLGTNDNSSSTSSPSTGGSSGNNNNNNNTTTPDTNDDPKIITAPISIEDSIEIKEELDSILGEGNWEYLNDSGTEDLPTLDSPEELENFLNSLTEGNFTLESSQMEFGNNSIRRDNHKLEVSSFPQASINCEMRVQLPTTENGLSEMKVLSMNTHLEGSTTIMDWTQTNTVDTNDQINGPTVEHYSLAGSPRLRVIVSGGLDFGIKYKGQVLGFRKLLEITISYNLNNNQIDPTWSYWDYL